MSIPGVVEVSNRRLCSEDLSPPLVGRMPLEAELRHFFSIPWDLQAGRGGGLRRSRTFAVKRGETEDFLPYRRELSRRSGVNSSIFTAGSTTTDPSRWSIESECRSQGDEETRIPPTAAFRASRSAAPKGTHQIRSLGMMVMANVQGRSPVDPAIRNPIGPRIFPSSPTSTIGQCLRESLAAIQYPIP